MTRAGVVALALALAGGCGYAPRGLVASPRATVRLARVVVADPDPTLAASLRTSLHNALAASGFRLGDGGAALRVEGRVVLPEAPGGAIAVTAAGATMTDARAVVRLRGYLEAGARVVVVEADGEGEAPSGDTAADVGEASRLARRVAAEEAARALAEALRERLEE